MLSNTGYEGVDLGPQKQALGQMNQLAGRQAQLAAAQTDTSNPIFQRLYGQEKAAGQEDLAATIAEISRQNRKLSVMGRKPLLDQERGGESVFRNLMLGQQDVGNQARNNAFNQLRLGQDAVAGAQGAYGNIFTGAGGVAQKELANKGMNIGANYSLGDVLQKLFGLDQQKETINWNQPSTPAGWTTYR